MKRWSSSKGCEVEKPRVDAFIEEVIAVCKKHGLSISHEDGYGAFIVEEYNEHCTEWFKAACDLTKDDDGAAK